MTTQVVAFQLPFCCETPTWNMFGGACGSAGLACGGALCGAGAGVLGAEGVRRMLRRHVGHVCCRWNHERRHDVWKMWLHGSFFDAVNISSRQMMQTLSAAASSSGVASGYNVFMFRIARRDRMTSLNAFLNDLKTMNICVKGLNTKKSVLSCVHNYDNIIPIYYNK